MKAQDYKPVPVEEAKAIAERYDKSIVIIFCHDPVHGYMHTTTYGTDPQNKAWAAEGGEIATRALGGLTDLSIGFEDYRLTQAQKLLYGLKTAIRMFKENNIKGAEVDMLKRAIKEAEKFLGKGAA
jgi:hypothetical protein